MPQDYEILDLQKAPNGLWKYHQAETNKTFSHYSYTAFRDQIREHRLANGIPVPPEWELILHDEMCKQNQWGWPTCRRYVQPHARGILKAIRAHDAINFLKVLGHWVKTGYDTVPEEEANRRAEICSTCPLNMQVDFSCGACHSTVVKLMNKLVGSRETKYHDKLKGCAVCGCVNAVQVWFPLNILRKGLDEDMQEKFRNIDYCWKGKEE